jgi:hypothetical protein
MTTNKDRLQDMLSPPSAPAPTNIERGTPFHLSQARPEATETDMAHLQTYALSERLREIARHYLGARRRSGEAMLEAARWMSEARSEAAHGEWQVFLEATGTSPDTAERLLNIHTQAMQHPQFAEAIIHGRLSQSAAALLARDSTPATVIDEMLASETPPSVAAVERAIRNARKAAAGETAHVAESGHGENPQFAGFGMVGAAPVEEITLKLLQDAAALLSDLAANAEQLPPGEATEQALRQVEQATAVLQRTLAQRTHLDGVTG